MLTIAEELLLLSLHDEKGTVIGSSSMALPYGIAGAIIMDLILSNKLKIENGLLKIIDSSPSNNLAFDIVIKQISASKKEKKVKDWVYKIGNNINDIKQSLLDNLIRNNILKFEEHKILWIFPANRYPTNNPIPEIELRNRLINAIIFDKIEDERLVILLSLIGSCELVNEVFPKESRKMAKAKIKELTKNNLIGKAMSDTIEEINTAVMVTIIAATTVTTITN